ncbi:MAG: hypothetical protein QE265_01260 [Rhodoferax sp.]|nr:hypothetical protein [Rhodoferax sp.]
MLALHENALLQALKGQPGIKDRLRAIDSLPKLFGDALLKKYVADAPALYVVPGRITFRDDAATMEFTVAGVVRNAAGQDAARKGDGIDLGCDHLMLMALVAINDKRLGNCSWNATSAEMADDELFEKAGISAVEVKFVSTAIAMPTSLDDDAFAQLDDFLRMHGDFKNSGGNVVAAMDIDLPGASTP